VRNHGPPPCNGNGASRESAEHAFDWNTIHCRLLWYYRGTPNTPSGTFETVNFIIWRLLHGSVEVEAATCRVHASAGDWVIMADNLGRRHQAFTPDAQIESLHMGIDMQPAVWSGLSVAVLDDDAALRRAVTDVGRHVLSRFPAGLCPGGHVFMSKDFLEQINVKKHLWSLVAKLVPQLAKAGMVIREPEFNDPRVIASMALIDNWPANFAWDREQVARAAGVSASQLDRIWREHRDETPFQYWSYRRIRAACDRLENSTCSIKEIAFNLGFAHQAQFTNWFHARMNTSPRDYRRAFTGKATP